MSACDALFSQYPLSTRYLLELRVLGPAPNLPKAKLWGGPLDYAFLTTYPE